MRLLRVVVALLLCSSVHAMDFPAGWDAYLEAKAAQVSDARHLPLVLQHGGKTAKSVLLVHGIFASPAYFRAMAESFYRQGHNVVSILLPGHWDKDFYSMAKIHEDEWADEVAIGWEFARAMGDKVILAGHSLGALLLMEQATLHPAEVHGLVFFSPALRLNQATAFAVDAGQALRIDGNLFTLSRPNGVDVPWFAPVAGTLIQRTYRRVLANPLPSAPLFMAYTVTDPVLDVGYLDRFFKRYPSPLKSKMRFSTLSGVFHHNIGESPYDRVGFYNPYFDKMMERAHAAVRSWENP